MSWAAFHHRENVPKTKFAPKQLPVHCLFKQSNWKLKFYASENHKKLFIKYLYIDSHRSPWFRCQAWISIKLKRYQPAVCWLNVTSLNYQTAFCSIRGIWVAQFWPFMSKFRCFKQKFFYFLNIKTMCLQSIYV